MLYPLSYEGAAPDRSPLAWPSRLPDQFLPALAVYALRSNREPLPLWAILAAGMGVGITLAFKPFFTVPVALCILFAAIRSRSWQVLFAPENIIAGVIVTMVSLGTYILYPEYFTITYKKKNNTYMY